MWCRSVVCVVFFIHYYLIINLDATVRPQIWRKKALDMRAEVSSMGHHAQNVHNISKKAVAGCQTQVPFTLYYFTLL